MQILLVEDDRKIASFIIKGLKQANFGVDHAVDGQDGLHMAISKSYDAAIIDIMLPRLDGLTLIQEIRRSKVKTPVIILSAKRTVDDRSRASRRGVTIISRNPFSRGASCQNASIDPQGSGYTEPTRLTAGDLSVDLLKRRLSGEDKR
jgi:DNA-binding response OmpR family regulator